MAIWLAAGLISTGANRESLAADPARTFPETGKTVSGRFLNYWNTHGGLAQQGYPITEEVQERSDTDGKSYDMQYFERAVFEYHPENAGKESEVLLSLLGALYYSDKYHGSAPAQHTSTDNPRLFNETGFTVGGAFRKYWETHGGLAQQGFPLSEEFAEIDKDGSPRTVQYFERAVFEYHPENSAPNNVLLSLLGVFYYNRQHGAGGGAPPVVPTAATGPGAPPAPTPTAAPAPPRDNSGQVLFYNSAIGSALVGRVDAGGNYSDLKVAVASGATGWTHIVAVGGGRLLFYNRVNGRNSVGQVAGDGTYADAPGGTYALTLGSGWTHVVSAGNDLVVYYNTNTGAGGTARVNADGTVTLLKAYTTFSTGWTHIAGLSNGVYFYYERGTGTAATDRVNDDGSIVRLKFYPNFIQKIWTSVTAGANGTILFYYSTDGRAVAGKVDNNGFYTANQGYPEPQGNPPLPNPFPVVAGLSNGTLLFYNDSQRSGATARLSADGSIPIYNMLPPGTFQAWTHVVAIR